MIKWVWSVQKWDKYPDDMLLRGDLLLTRDGNIERIDTFFLGVPLWEIQAHIPSLEAECNRRNQVSPHPWE